MVSKEEWSYIAGILDGEGTIGFHKVKAGKHGRKSDGFVPRLAIFNTNKEVLNWISNLLGGHPRLHRKADLKNKACFIWEIRCGPKVTTVLKNLLPYLIIKKRQARVILKYCDLRSRKYRNLERDERGKMKTWELSKEEMDLVKMIYQLNKRGSQNSPVQHVESTMNLI